MKNLIRSAILGLLALPGGAALATTFQLFSPATGILKGNASTYVTTAATAADVISLWSGTCNSTTFLRADGSCNVAGSGTVSSITASAGISSSPNPIIATGTLSLDLTYSPTWTGIHTFSGTYTNLAQDDVDHTGSAGNWRFHQTGSDWSIQQCDTFNTDCLSKLLFSATGNHSTLGSGGNTTLTSGSGSLVFSSGNALLTSEYLAIAANGGTPETLISPGGLRLFGLGAVWQSIRNNTDDVEMVIGSDITHTFLGSVSEHPLEIYSNDTLRARFPALGGFDVLSGNLQQNGVSACLSNGTNCPAGSAGANPTATIGATAVNGVATTFLRSDGAPALPATLPALSGVNLTALNGTNIASGTVAVARGGTGVGTSTGTGSVVLSASPTLTGTTTAATVAATTVTVGGNNVCQSTGTNCPAAASDVPSYSRFTTTGSSCTAWLGAKINISSCARTSAGLYNVTLTSGGGGNTPSCVVSNADNTQAGIASATSTSSTNVQVQMRDGSGTAADVDFFISCHNAP